MKMINIITEEMIMKIIPLTNKEELSFSVDENGITYEAGEGDDSYMIDFYDLACFLFMDAWNYFKAKGWKITMSDWNERVELQSPEFDEPNFPYKDYPSRLHALATAAAYMWGQEEKINER